MKNSLEVHADLAYGPSIIWQVESGEFRDVDLQVQVWDLLSGFNWPEREREGVKFRQADGIRQKICVFLRVWEARGWWCRWRWWVVMFMDADGEGSGVGCGKLPVKWKWLFSRSQDTPLPLTINVLIYYLKACQTKRELRLGGVCGWGCLRARVFHTFSGQANTEKPLIYMLPV